MAAKFAGWLVLAVVVAQAPEAPKPAVSNVMNAPFPAIYADGRVAFRLRAPNATRVQLQPGGSDNGLGKAPFDMTKGDDGIWTRRSRRPSRGSTTTGSWWTGRS